MAKLIKLTGGTFFECIFPIATAFFKSYFDNKDMMFVALYAFASVISFTFICSFPKDVGFTDMIVALALGFRIYRRHHAIVFTCLVISPYLTYTGHVSVDCQ